MFKFISLLDIYRYVPISGNIMNKCERIAFCFSKEQFTFVILGGQWSKDY